MNPQIIIAALIGAVAFGSGWKVQGWRKDSEIAGIHESLATAREVARLERKNKEKSINEAARLALELETERQREARIVEREVEKEVIKYVQSDAANACTLDPVWVRIHNRAASGRMPDAATDTAAPTGGASRAAALEAVTVNYRIYHELKNRHITLQDFVRGLYE